VTVSQYAYKGRWREKMKELRAMLWVQDEMLDKVVGLSADNGRSIFVRHR